MPTELGDLVPLALTTELVPDGSANEGVLFVNE
jgi:hypothetical protein